MDPNMEKPSQSMVRVKKWNLIATWNWSIKSDVCAICRVHVMDACSECQVNRRADQCQIVWGECKHSFHNCCMIQWIQRSKRCPLCQHEWKNASSHRIG